MSSAPRLVRLLAVLGRLVPASERADWQHEWEAELHYAAAGGWSASLRLMLRALGALPDAVYLRCRDWSADMLAHDIRYGIRSLVKGPAFTLAATLTLAVGIGANTAIFSLVNAVLLEPLPFANPHQLVEIWEVNPVRGWDLNVVAPANLYDWRARNRSFEALAFYFGGVTTDAGVSGIALTGSGEPQRLDGLEASANFFEVLGVRAARGRTFHSGEDQPGRDAVVVISDGLWRRAFGSDPLIVGKTIMLNGRPNTVIGVMPARFAIATQKIDLWRPLAFDPASLPNLRRPHMLRVFGRLKDGVSLAQAREDMVGIARQLEREYPDTNTAMGVGLGPLHDWIVGDVRTALLVFAAAVGFVLLIACVNVANLLLARAASRTREIAIRAALGASRFRVVRQLLVESLLLSLVGGAAGLLLARAMLSGLTALPPDTLPRVSEIAIDARVMWFSLILSAITGMAFGLVPAVHSARGDLHGSLKEGNRGASGSKRSSWTRRALVTAEVALSLVLLVSATLLIRSFVALQQVDPGFDSRNVLTFQLALPRSIYDTNVRRAQFHEQLLEHLRALPGVEAAGATSRMPLNGVRWTGDFAVEGRAASDYGIEVRHKEIAPGYFETMRIPLLRGRHLSSADRFDAPLTVVVNDALARRYFPNEDPVGRRIKFARPDRDSPWRTIVGVVGNEKQDGLDAAVRPEIFVTHLQAAQGEMSYVVRTASTLTPAILEDAVRREVRALDPNLPIYRMQPIDEMVAASMAGRRFNTALLVAFAIVALGLAAIGIYGVVAYTTAQRTNEIGIRMALGAQPRDVRRLILVQGLRPVAAGVAIGLPAAVLSSRVLGTMLFGVTSSDPITFGVAPVIFLAVALAGMWLPARRATRVDPLSALRAE